MTDGAARGLERRAARSGSIEDQARALVQGVRSGALARDRLELAAALGDPPAALALGVTPPADLKSWGYGLERFGPEVTLRAGLADVERCLRRLRRALDEEAWPPSLRELIAVHERVADLRAGAIATWTLLPGPRARDLVEETLRAEPELPPVDVAWLEAASSDGREVALAATQALLATRTLADHAVDGRRVSVGEWWPEALPAVTEVRVRAAIRRALAPWAVGGDDPLLAAGALDRLGPASPCDARWEDMGASPDERTRWCGRCDRPVHDLAGLTPTAALALLRGALGERLCVRFLAHRDGPVLAGDCPVGLRRRARRLPRALDEGSAARLLGGWSW